MTRTVRFVRHGQSLANAGQATADPATIPLTDRGRQQAGAFADALSYPPALIAASPFLRARQTAEPCIRRFAHAATDIWPVQEFTYVNLARMAPMTPEGRGALREEYWNRRDPFCVTGPDAESFEQFWRRLAQSMERASALDHAAAIVFAHGFFIRAALWRLENPQERSLREAMNECHVAAETSPFRNLESLLIEFDGSCVAGWKRESLEDLQQSTEEVQCVC